MIKIFDQNGISINIHRIGDLWEENYRMIIENMFVIVIELTETNLEAISKMRWFHFAAFIL